MAATATATRRLHDGMLSIGSLSVVVGAIAAIDESVRRHLVHLVDGSYSAAITMPDLRIHHITRLVTDTVGLPMGTESPLLVFVLVAAALFVLMFRS